MGTLQENNTLPENTAGGATKERSGRTCQIQNAEKITSGKGTNTEGQTN